MLTFQQDILRKFFLSLQELCKLPLEFFLTPLGFLIIFRLQVCQLLPGNLIFGHSLKYGIVTQITEFALHSLRLDGERQQQKRQTQD